MVDEHLTNAIAPVAPRRRSGKTSRRTAAPPTPSLEAQPDDEHVRTIAGEEGPISIEEESGVAAAEAKQPKRRGKSAKPSNSPMPELSLSASRSGRGARYWGMLVGAYGLGLALGLFAKRPHVGKPRLAHRADGRDDSRSFAAGIADEGSIPDVDPPLAEVVIAAKPAEPAPPA